jgi:phosphoribosylformylglycinamidine cyclo-ligase
MYKVFNMGHRMEVYLPQQHAAQVIEISKKFGVEAKIIGRVEASAQKKVTVKSEFGVFEY